MTTKAIIITMLSLVLLSPLMAEPPDATNGVERVRAAWLKDASEQDILNRIREALGSQDIEVTDRSKLMGIAKGLGLIN